MKILYLNYGPQSGVTAAVQGRLRAAGHRVVHFDPVPGFLWKTRLAGVQVPRLLPEQALGMAAAARRFGGGWRMLYLHTCYAFDRLTARCRAAIDEHRPDAILQAGVLFAPGQGAGTPSFLYCDHTRAIAEAYPPLAGLPPPIPHESAWRERETAVYHRAERIFAMSEHVKRSLVDTYRVPPARVSVVGAGPNVEPVFGAPRRPRKQAFLFVGVDFDRKGGPELLAAFPLVRERHPEAELWMVGAHQPATAPAGVKLLGARSADAVARLYERASAFVLPTIQEPFGLAYLEAMSFGLPCIGSDLEAIPEIIDHGQTGLLVPVRDPKALAAAMIALLDDPARAHAMGQAGRARVAAEFGWDRAVALMLDAIEERPRTSQPARVLRAM